VWPTILTPVPVNAERSPVEPTANVTAYVFSLMTAVPTSAQRVLKSLLTSVPNVLPIVMAKPAVQTDAAEAVATV